MSLESCYCGSGKTYAECCEPLIKGAKAADTAESLMRARYSAYVVADIDYIGESTHPDHRHTHDEAATRRWAESATWLGLEIVGAAGGSADDEKGTVEFIASYKEDGVAKKHHEISTFEKKDGTWYLIDGQLVSPETVRNDTPKVGRNEPCPCGSGKKYKKCCGK